MKFPFQVCEQPFLFIERKYTYKILSCGVLPRMNGPHKPAEMSPVVFGENSLEKIVNDIPFPNCSCSRIAVVDPITPAPIIAICVTELILRTFF